MHKASFLSSSCVRTGNRDIILPICKSTRHFLTCLFSYRQALMFAALLHERLRSRWVVHIFLNSQASVLCLLFMCANFASRRERKADHHKGRSYRLRRTWQENSTPHFTSPTGSKGTVETVKLLKKTSLKCLSVLRQLELNILHIPVGDGISETLFPWTTIPRIASQHGKWLC